MSWNISNPDTIGVGLYNCINYVVLVQKFKPFLTMAPRMQAQSFMDFASFFILFLRECAFIGMNSRAT